jgi:hypothetical protein
MIAIITAERIEEGIEAGAAMSRPTAAAKITDPSAKTGKAIALGDSPARAAII